jgi:hypothetical protein
VRLPILSLLILGALAAAILQKTSAQGKQTFTGVITDSMCSTGDHSRMRMGPTNADCTIACVMAHDADYVLYNGKDVYVLSDQRTPEKFAGRNVRVVGTLEAKARKIQVESIAAAN